MPIRLTPRAAVFGILLASLSFVPPQAHAATFLDPNNGFQPVAATPAATPAPAAQPKPAAAKPAAVAPSSLGGGNPGTTPSPLGGGNPGNSNSQGGNNGLVNPIQVDSLAGLLNLILDALMQLATVVLILAFIWVGFLFVRAQGKAEELKKARAAFLWTVIGGAILLGAKVIAALIQSTVQSL